MEIQHILNQLGFNDKETRVYLTLLSGGPSSVRKLAADTGANRGTVYDALKLLQRHGLVGIYQKHKKQFFLAEDPQKLIEVVEHRERSISALRRQLAELLPEIRSVYAFGGTKPVVKYYEGPKGVNIILRDVLQTMSDRSDKTYCVYSSLSLREHLYKSYPHFTQERIARNLRVKVIAMGAGGEDQPLAERRWLSRDEGAPTYSIIYGSKVAFFSIGGNDNLLGVLIEDPSVAETERIIFDRVWEALAK
jgi:HTH-type transcriptional regulator, sugar sensing transcriptional regulator